MLFRIPNFQQQQKTIRNANKQGSMAHTHTLTKISVETVPEEAQVLDLLEKIFKINPFKYIERTKRNHV